MSSILVFVFFAFIFFAFIFTIIIVINNRYDERRKRALREVSEHLGYSFDSRRGDYRNLPNHDSFALFNRGHSKRVADRFYSGPDGCEASVFLYSHSSATAGSRRKHTASQTVVMMRTVPVMATFELRPEYLRHKLSTAFGCQDIDFDAYPRFSKRYLLRGEDVPQVRATFTHKALEYLGQHGGLSIECSGKHLIVYRRAKNVAPAQIEGLLKQALTVREMFMAEEAPGPVIQLCAGEDACADSADRL